jgi:hypothetical protein
MLHQRQRMVNRRMRDERPLAGLHVRRWNMRQRDHLQEI